MLQLNPPLPLITPKGTALCHFVIDEGIEHNLVWVTFLDSNGECWSFETPEIRMERNLTIGRDKISPIPAK
jgi:hypothetical protein